MTRLKKKHSVCKMSENFQQVFTDFVSRQKAALAGVDRKYPPDVSIDDCTKYIEKLKIYKLFTDGLVTSGSNYLRIIDHLNQQMDQLQQSTSDVSSDTSHSEEKVYAELELLRRCLESRIGQDEKAISSLSELESMIYSLLKENARLTGENKISQSQPQPSTKVASTGATINENVASNVIQSLTQENKELKQIIDRNRQLKKMIQSKSQDSTDDKDAQVGEINCEEELEELKKQLAKKEKTIEQLSAQIKDLKSKESVAKTKSTEESGKSPRKTTRSQSDTPRPSPSKDGQSITDSEMRETDMVRKLENGYKELAQLLKEKYEQLRKQREKIAELLKQLEKCAQTEQELVGLKESMAKLRARNKQLEDEIKGLNGNLEALQDFKNQSEHYKYEIDELKKREQIVARKLTVDDEHIKEFMGERQNLLRINNEMLNSIAVCQKELCRFNVE